MKVLNWSNSTSLKKDDMNKIIMILIPWNYRELKLEVSNK